MNEKTLNKILDDFKQKGLISKKWKFKWSNSKRVLGLCDYVNKTIYISRYHAKYSSRSNVIDTMNHEIAHIIAGSKAGHGDKWKRACSLTGARPEARCHRKTHIPPKYIGYCPVCFETYERFNRSSKMYTLVCIKRRCIKYGKVIQWEINY